MLVISALFFLDVLSIVDLKTERSLNCIPTSLLISRAVLLEFAITIICFFSATKYFKSISKSPSPVRNSPRINNSLSLTR